MASTKLKVGTKGTVTAGHTLESDLSGGLKNGGSGKNGRLNLEDRNGKVKVHAIAKEAGGKLTLHGSNEKQRLLFDGENARLTVGGNGKAGSVSVVRGNATFGQGEISRIAIELDGATGNIILKNAENKVAIQLNSSTGDIILRNADCAEEFDIAETTEVIPGTVMVLDQEGKLQCSREAYDNRVAGVISGAGNFKPGIVLDRQQSQYKRLPLALVGKVYCQVDASFSPIEVGDLLTTSETPGHAMRATDPLKAFGAVIGKALRPLKSGQGLIPILIALQ